MIYSDRPASSFWSNYIKHSPATEGLPSGVQFAPETGNGNDNLRLVHKVLQYLEENGVTRKVGDMEFYGIRDWGREPYRGAAHAWYPERKSSEFLRRLSAFGIGDYDCDHHMSPKHERNIHICGEAYSDYQAFIEGALRSSEHVLHCIDREAFPETPTPWLCDKPCVHEKGPQLPEQFRTLMDAAAKAAQHPSPETR